MAPEVKVVLFGVTAIAICGDLTVKPPHPNRMTATDGVHTRTLSMLCQTRLSFRQRRPFLGDRKLITTEFVAVCDALILVESTVLGHLFLSIIVLFNTGTFSN